jgi:hypothetical protein
MATVEQKQKIIKAGVSVVVCDVLGRAPKNVAFDHISMFARAICKAVPSPRCQRKTQKK